MSTYLLSYRVGTLSVANGSTSVTGTLTVWTTNVQPGDLLVIGPTWAEIASIQSNTALTLVSAWPGSTVTGSSYIIHRYSKGWSAAGTTALLLSLYESNRPSFIPTTGAPSNSIGADGNIAVDWTAGLMYRKAAGVWGDGIAFRTRPSGAYSGATAYAAGDIVTNQSASWIARVATTGVAPPTLPTETNTQWQLIGKSGDLTRSGTTAIGSLAAWVAANGAQLRAATSTEVQTAAGMSQFFQSLVTGGSSYNGFLQSLGMRLNVGTLADDSVGVINVGSPAYGVLFIAATSASTVRPGVYFFRTASGPQFGTIAEYAGGGAPPSGAYTTALTGTTGTDGAFNIGVDTAGNLYFENRRGFAAAVSAYVLRV